MTRVLIIVTFVLVFEQSGALGAITTYTNKQEWQAAVVAHTTITFQEFPVGTWVNDQYADLGVTFDLNANNHSQIQSNPAFLNDGIGLVSFGLSTSPVVRFMEPRFAIAVDTPNGAPNFWLYYQGSQVGTASVPSLGYFKGIVSTLPFDTVLFLPTGIDDLYFGPPIPAPGVVALLGVAAFGGRRRRI